MNRQQYELLLECINIIGVFQEKLTMQVLKDLLAGKRPRLLHITNQKQFTYLFDQLRDNGLIAKNWITIAGYNHDFVSVNPRTKDDKLHFISSQQFTNCRRANKSQAILGLNTIDDMLEQMADL